MKRLSAARDTFLKVSVQAWYLWIPAP